MQGAGGWWREREQERGALKHINHPWFPHPFWKQMRCHHCLPRVPSPGTGGKRRVGASLLTPGPRPPAGCCDIWMPMCSSLCGAASFWFAARQTRRTPRTAGKPPETRGGAWDPVSLTALGAPSSSSLQNAETKHGRYSQRPRVRHRRRQPCGG